MKKNYYFLVSSMFFLMVAGAFISPPAATPIPDALNVVFKSSCMACHATGGSMMAMSKVNFSAWDTYDTVKQAKKAAAICNVVTKGVMPPKSFIKSNPGAALTDEQKALISKWSAELNPKK